MATRGRGFAPWLTAALLTLAGVAWSLPMATHRSLGVVQHSSDQPPAVFRTAIVRKGDVSVTLSGRGAATPSMTVSVRPQVSGRIVQIGFDEGQMVKEGDFLAEIDPRAYRHALAEAQGALLRDQALLSSAELDLEQAEQSQSARAQLEAQKARRDSYKGMVAMDEARVDRAQLDLDDCRIIAPASGRAGLRQFNLGDYVQPSGAKELVAITRTQPIAVVFTISADYLSKALKQVLSGPRPPVEAYDRSDGRLIAKGVLTTLDNEADPTTGEVKLKAEFANDDLALFPNQIVDVRLAAETLSGATLIPAGSVQHGPSGPFIYVLHASGAVSTRPIALGPVEGDEAVVKSGVEEGEQVILDGVKARAMSGADAASN